MCVNALLAIGRQTDIASVVADGLNGPKRAFRSLPLIPPSGVGSGNFHGNNAGPASVAHG
jgi:hypothetical protein